MRINQGAVTQALFKGMQKIPGEQQTKARESLSTCLQGTLHRTGAGPQDTLSFILNTCVLFNLLTVCTDLFLQVESNKKKSK